MEPEKRTCKLCNRSFPCGRALGGHMRSHMISLSQPPKIQAYPTVEFTSETSQEVEEEQEPEEEEEEKGVLGYGLRENPRKSFKLADPEFSFMVDAGSVVQDSQSETELSGGPVRNPSRRRSKRRRRTVENEAEPVSSVSDTTPEEDVAICLMMLSRDVRQPPADSGIGEDSDDSEKLEIQQRRSVKYQCSTCKKIFHSYQALGGHRASHKKIKGCSVKLQEADSDAGIVGFSGDRKIHECPVCFKVFGSGQALGGHKRSHLSTAKLGSMGDNLLDLNLPAPLEDDEISQVELSAVSDAEFIDPAK